MQLPLPQCSLLVIMIREFNFVPLENQGKIRECCNQFPVGTLFKVVSLFDPLLPMMP